MAPQHARSPLGGMPAPLFDSVMTSSMTSTNDLGRNIQRPYIKKTMHSMQPVMLVWAPLIPATRWSHSQQSLLSAGGQLQLHLVAGIRGAQINITQAIYRSVPSPYIRSLEWCTMAEVAEKSGEWKSLILAPGKVLVSEHPFLRWKACIQKIKHRDIGYRVPMLLRLFIQDVFKTFFRPNLQKFKTYLQLAT